MLKHIIDSSTEEELEKLKDQGEMFKYLDLNKEMLNDTKKIILSVKQFMKTLPTDTDYKDLKRVIKTHQNKNIKDLKREGSAESRNFLINTTMLIYFILNANPQSASLSVICLL